MDIWIKAAQLFLSLAILVTLHEFGHFLPARLFKTRIEKFYLFFNPWFSLFRYKKVNGVKKTAWFKKDSPKEWKEDPVTRDWVGGLIRAQERGRPLANLLRVSAASLVDQRARRAQMQVSKLGVKLSLPIGICFLPAFIFGAIVPIVLTFFSTLKFF